MSLLSEIKRRKVLRVATLYAVVAWLLIQVATTTAPLMNLPDAAPRFVLFLLIVLFPVALLLAWAYQITPDGIRIDTGSGDAEVTGSTRRASIVVTIAAGAVLAAGFGLYFYNSPSQPDATGAESAAATAAGASVVATGKSIAVLPFTAFSSSEEDRFFADGLSDTLLNKLAQLSDVRVMSRSASFQYRGDAVDIGRVGEELRVATVLEGSVQRSGNRLRIIAQLIDTASGGHLWSDTFDRSGDDIFVIHDEIADAVVENLALSLTPAERQRLRSSGTDSVEAYTRLNEIAERSASVSMFNTRASEFKAQQYALIEDARLILEIDPGYANVYRFIAEAYDRMLFTGGFSAEDDAYHLREAYAALYQAMTLNPEDPRVLLRFASLSRREDNYARAEAFARMAYARAPSSVGAAVEMSLVLVEQAKNPDEVLTFVELEESLDPTGDRLYRRKIFALEGLGRYDEALAVAREALVRNPQDQLAASDVAVRLSDSLGRYAEAFEALMDFRTRAEDDVADAIVVTWIGLAADLGMADELEKNAPRLENRSRQALALGRALALRGRLQEANDWIRSYAEQSSAGGAIHASLAVNCLLLGDYACAVAESLIASPQLDARAGRTPSIVTTDDFEVAVHLAHAFRESGEVDAAARLLQAAARWYDTRAVDGYVHSPDYFVPELYVLRGDPDRALAEIRERVMLDEDRFVAHCGGCGFEMSIYDPLRGYPEFDELVAEYERRRARAVAEVRAMIELEGF